jgi:hypothetical protein
MLNRSSDYGFTWDFGAGSLIDGITDCSIVLQGARAVGAPGEQVLVCYYDSGTDGFAPGDSSSISNKFFMTCQSSADRWTTPASGLIAASANIPNELPYWLGPNAAYHIWWMGMFPSMVIDHLGTAHVVFGADPNNKELDPESGNVYEIKNANAAASPPWGTGWSGRSAVGSGAYAQGWGTVSARQSNTQPKPLIYTAYADHAVSKAWGKGNENIVYDVKYRLSTKGGGSYAKPVNVSDATSRSQFVLLGDYFDSAADARNFHVIWTDRARFLDVFQYDHDVYYDKF